MLFKNHNSIICITGYYLKVFKMFCTSIMNTATVKTVIYYVMCCYINCLNCVQYTQMTSSTQLNIKYSILLLIFNFFFCILYKYILLDKIIDAKYLSDALSWLSCGLFFVCVGVFFNMKLIIHTVLLIGLTLQYFLRKHFTHHTFHFPWYLTKDI